jgi:hypothetical protein
LQSLKSSKEHATDASAPGAAEQRDELAPFHSITSSARPSSIGGHVERDSWNETIWDM